MGNNETHNEIELFNRIAEGDENAFTDLYALLKPKIVGYIIKLTKSEDATEEIIQEALIRFWMNRDKLPAIENPHAWLFRIIANESYRYFHKHGLQQRLIAALSDQSSDTTIQTELELTFRETQRIIQEIIATLPPRHQEIYTLSRQKGLKLQEIADVTGLSYRYVKKVLIEALKMLRERLIKMGRMAPFLFL